MTRKIKINGLYKHFKGHIYKVIAIAKDCEDLTLKVVYQNINNNDIWVRDYNEFLSEVDKNKYPEVTQQYRFQELTREEALKEMLASLENEYPDMANDARNAEAYKRLGFDLNEQVLMRTK